MSTTAYRTPVSASWRSAYRGQRLRYAIGSTIIAGDFAYPLVLLIMHKYTGSSPWWAYAVVVMVLIGYLYVLVATRCWTRLWLTTGITAVIAKIYGKIGVVLLIVILAVTIIGLFAASGIVRSASERERVTYIDDPW